MSLYCLHGNLHAECAACAVTGRQMERLRAEVADLKARLRAVGEAHAHVMWVGVPENLMRQATCATDLRRKNWRKP